MGIRDANIQNAVALTMGIIAPERTVIFNSKLGGIIAPERVAIIAPEKPRIHDPLPDPPPDEVMEMAKQVIRAMKPEERKATLTQVKVLRSYVNAIEKALGKG